jgi:hypothetical protein
VSLIRKKTFYLQYCMGTPEGQQKNMFNTSKVKKKKQRFIWDLFDGASRLDLKSLKKLSKHENNQSKQKSMFDI